VSERIERIKKAVEAKEHSRATHIQSLPVRERLSGETVWEGVVETFDLQNHPMTKRAYAWERWEPGEEPQYTVVLGIPPVNSASDAVKAAIMAVIKKL
jgi:hypothetical protein